MKRLLAAAGVLLVTSVPAALGASSSGPDGPVGGASAKAWALHVSVVAGEAHSLRLAEASAQNGSTSVAQAIPMLVDGAGDVASATLSRPDVVKTPLTWTDQTGSVSLEGWFAEAHARDTSSQARTGFGAMTGSGFALASELLTWEQQEQLLGQWTEIGDLVAAQLNAALLPLAPVLAAAGVALPAIEAPPSVGFVDFAGARQVASLADTSSGAGLASARADTTLGSVGMLAGFLEFDDVAATAVSESAGDTETLEAHATVGRVRIGGIEALVDDDGVHLASSGLLPRAVVEPVLDALVDALAAAGVTIRAASVRDGADGLREASALEVSVVSPLGSVLVSLAHAEAAATAEAVVDAAPAPSGGGVEVQGGSLAPAAEPEVPHTGGGPAPGDPDVGNDAPRVAASGPLARTLPVAVVRAMRTTFLIVLVGGALGALLVPVLIGSMSRKRGARR
jgi:hypothetical protein